MTHRKMTPGTRTTYPAPDNRKPQTDEQAIADSAARRQDHMAQEADMTNRDQIRQAIDDYGWETDRGHGFLDNKSWGGWSGHKAGRRVTVEFSSSGGLTFASLSAPGNRERRLKGIGKAARVLEYMRGGSPNAPVRES